MPLEVLTKFISRKLGAVVIGMYFVSTGTDPYKVCALAACVVTFIIVQGRIDEKNGGPDA